MPAPAHAALPAKAATAPPLIDLYSGSQASVAVTDEALRTDIIAGLRGAQTYTIPGSVDSKEDRQYAFRRCVRQLSQRALPFSLCLPPR